jgi:Fe-Mn family superoxide dismutase
MLFVYGTMMSLRILEEIHFWKTQEKEHTVVIRTLAPTLESEYAKALQEWEVVFEQTELAAQQWIEWTLRTQLPSDPYLNEQVTAILDSSKVQSIAFIQQLIHIEHNSIPIRTNPIVKIVLEHIIRESEYFLGVLEALSASSPPHPAYS